VWPHHLSPERCGHIPTRISRATVEDGPGWFLSACETALGGVKGLDEAISVAAAMWHAGWRHIIGTVWSVPDRSAAKVARAVYRDLVTDGVLDASAAAHALHHVVRTMRDSSPGHPSAWAPFIHLGP
jgi:CHAT domain-containing protein